MKKTLLSTLVLFTLAACGGQKTEQAASAVSSAALTACVSGSDAPPAADEPHAASEAIMIPASTPASNFPAFMV